jgi:CheY-like chemotaxis protein
VKGLTELHGGTVEATSAGLGKGAEFTVRIPITAATPVVATPTRRQPNLQESKKVLLIEDNRDAAQTMRLLLQHRGFEVEIAFTGPEGVSVAEIWGPDVVICDIGLPGLDGFGVARALRSNVVTRETYLIAQSGYGQAEDIRKGLDAGFDLHLIKPVDFSRLEEALRTSSRNTRIPIDA